MPFFKTFSFSFFVLQKKKKKISPFLYPVQTTKPARVCSLGWSSYAATRFPFG